MPLLPHTRLDTSRNALTLELLRLTEAVQRYTLMADDPLGDRAGAVALVSELRALAGRVEVTGREMIAALVTRPH